jgi:hypothetical protein
MQLDLLLREHRELSEQNELLRMFLARSQPNNANGNSSAAPTTDVLAQLQQQNAALKVRRPRRRPSCMAPPPPPPTPLIPLRPRYRVLGRVW